MRSRVHAILVARDHAQHLRRTLAALKAQTTPPAMLTIVLLGRDEQVRAVASASGADAVIAAPDGTSYAKAVGLAARRTAIHPCPGDRPARCFVAAPDRGHEREIRLVASASGARAR